MTEHPGDNAVDVSGDAGFVRPGFVTRPVREKSPETLCAQAREMAKNTGYDEISMCSLSISDYSRVNSLCDSLLTWTDDAKINLSLPSLRADSFTRELMEQISTVRSSTLTFAPEAGSQRLRDVINKNVTEEDILRAAGVAFSSGKSQVKLYFMNGRPMRHWKISRGLQTLAKNVVESYYKTPGRAKGSSQKSQSVWPLYSETLYSISMGGAEYGGPAGGKAAAPFVLPP